MRLDIHTHRFTLTDALRCHVQRRLNLALNSGDDQILRIVIRLSDINGPRGGADKRCQIQVVLANVPDVIIRETQADLYAAIDRATDRAGRAVHRRLARQRSRRRAAPMAEHPSTGDPIPD